MIRFLFGQGWMIAWHLAFYVVLLLGAVLPTVAFMPLKQPGEKPDTPSLGSFAFVMMIAATMGLLTLADTAALAAMARGPWFHRLVVAIGAGTLVGVGMYFPAVHLATQQNRPAMLLLAACIAALAIANLVLLHLARGAASEPLSLHLPWPLLVVFTLLSLPVFVGIALLPLTLVMPFLKR